MEAEDCTLERILITHGHSDHYGGCPEIQRRWGPVPVGMMDQGFAEMGTGPTAPGFVEAMEERGIIKILDEGAARPLPSAFGGNWWSKDIFPEDYDVPLDPWPDDDDISWVKEFATMGTRSPTKEWMAFQYFMSLRWTSGATREFQEQWLDDDDDRMPAVSTQSITLGSDQSSAGVPRF